MNSANVPTRDLAVQREVRRRTRARRGSRRAAAPRAPGRNTASTSATSSAVRTTSSDAPAEARRRARRRRRGPSRRGCRRSSPRRAPSARASCSWLIFVRCGVARRVAAEADAEQRQRREHGEREPPVDDEQHRSRRRRSSARSRRVADRVEEPRDELGVVRRARDQLARADAVVVARIELERAPEDPVADGGVGRRAVPDREVVARAAGDRLDRPERRRCPRTTTTARRGRRGRCRNRPPGGRAAAPRSPRPATASPESDRADDRPAKAPRIRLPR